MQICIETTVSGFPTDLEKVLKAINDLSKKYPEIVDKNNVAIAVKI